MKNIVLSDRLGVIARFIKQDASVADVGTDHGYIPVYLAQNKIARRIIASDVKKGPLEHAMASAEEYGVNDRIEFVLTDGLDTLESAGLDTVIIAGMGGETIAAILEKAPWTRTKNVRLILQPQSKCDELSAWLDSNGYLILDAALAEDDGRIYSVLLAGADDSWEPDSGTKACGPELCVDRIFMEKREALFPRYLDMLIEKAQKTIKGLEQARKHVRTEELTQHKQLLERLIHMKEETDKW